MKCVYFFIENFVVFSGCKMQNTIDKQRITLSCPKCFDLGLCLDCGQAFRWEKDGFGFWHGVIGDSVFSLKQDGTSLFAKTENAADKARVINDYFDFDRDYDLILTRLKSDKSLKEAADTYYGIRILRQEPWEALCSFIISQNNNIPRIKGIISRLCENFGTQIDENNFTFPSALRLASLDVGDLAPVRSGFRAKYIIDAAKKVSGGEIDFDRIQNENIDDARIELMRVKGVGPKVAECTLLYGFNRVEAFPVDVWVKRIMSELYPDGMPSCFKGAEGIAQQYLFHWRRNSDK